jgi:hypothetical protein
MLAFCDWVFAPMQPMTAAAGMIALVAICAPSWKAHAQDPAAILLMVEGPEAATLAEALSVQTAGTGTRVVVSSSPLGETALGRAASAQQTARTNHARLALWIEKGAESDAYVHVVSADGDAPRRAALPGSATAVDPRLFAVVAQSLLAEVGGPLDTPTATATEVEIQVNVELTTTSPTMAPREDLVPAPPSSSSEPISAHEQPASMLEHEHAGAVDRFVDTPLVLKAGITTAGISAGLVIAAELPIARHVRLSLHTMMTKILVDEGWGGATGIGFGYVGNGPNGRFEIGGELNLVYVVTSQTRSPDCVVVCATDGGVELGAAVGGYLGWTWELGRVGLGVRLHALLAVVEETLMPAPLVTGFLEVPL